MNVELSPKSDSCKVDSYPPLRLLFFDTDCDRFKNESD